jgi:hypothetical protein
MYGLNHEESDEDVLGCFIEPPKNAFGLSKLDNFKNPSSDESYKSFREYIKHLVNGSSFWVETLFAPEECVITSSLSFNEVLNHKEYFLTKALIKKSLGFMKGMHTAGLTVDDAKVRKNISHSVRVGYMINRWLDTGEFLVRMPEHIDEIMRIKLGESCLQKSIESSMALYDKIDAKFQTCSVPEVIDLSLANELIAKTIFDEWKLREEIL